VSDGLQGRTLAEYLAANGKMPLGEGLVVLDDLLQVVGEGWHRRGKADGALTCARVFIPEVGHAQVVPAGAADPDAEAYLSPQQRDGKPVDARADVYALGVIAYKALTGMLPYAGGGENPADPRTVLPNLTERVRESLMIAVQNNLTDRFADALTFRAALRGDSDLALDSPTLKWAVPEGIPEGDTGAADEFANEEALVADDDDGVSETDELT
jgi:serine/threonine-protein kinase